MTARLPQARRRVHLVQGGPHLLRDDKGNPKRYIGTLNDVDSATRSVLALKYRAKFDLLTDLYNMHTFYSQRHRPCTLPRAPLQHRPHGHRPLQGHQRPVRP